MTVKELITSPSVEEGLVVPSDPSISFGNSDEAGAILDQNSFQDEESRLVTSSLQGLKNLRGGASEGSYIRIRTNWKRYAYTIGSSASCFRKDIIIRQL